MKFITTKWSTTWAKMKSANPRSGLIPKNCALFSGLTCILKQTEKNLLLYFITIGQRLMTLQNVSSIFYYILENNRIL